MNERLEIYNFGPIKEAKIDLRDLTVFIGPQATGKSIAAQLIYFMRGLEDILLPDLGPDVEETEAVLSALEWWLGNPVSIYAEAGARLIWHPGDSTEAAIQEIQWIQNGLYLSETLKARIQRWLGIPPSSGLMSPPKHILKQVYIPAGRTLYSFVPPHSTRFYTRLAQQWPGYIHTFYETLGTTVQRLWQFVQSPGRQLSMFDMEDIPARVLPAPFIQKYVQAILKGQILYGPERVLLDIGGKFLKPSTIAAGQMELWPFWAIIESVLEFDDTPVSKTQIYVEEPEAHLHPSAQRMILEIVAYLVGQGNKFVLTTHTPYILYAINNFLMAQKVLESGRSLPETVPQETALRPDQVAAYCFSSEGQVYNILDAEVGLIDTDELDQVADNLGAIFTDLQERLEDSA